MGFDSGNLSFQRFAVIGNNAPKSIDEQLLAKVQQYLLNESDLGQPEDVEYGWAGPRHYLDKSIDFETCVYNDCLWLGLRIDTNKPPASIVRAYTAVEEQAVAKRNPSGFISKSQKRDIKDAIAGRIDQEKSEGKFRRSKHVPVLWDVPAGILYGPTSAGPREMLTELFTRTFDLQLFPLTAGTEALRRLEKLGHRRDYEDFTPTRFADSREDPATPAEYPWTAKGDGAKDYLGNEFLVWLWHATAERSTAGDKTGDVCVMFDRTLQMDCVYNQSGKDTFAGTGPTRMPEAVKALHQGKVPRSAGLILDAAGGQFNCRLTGESLAVSALKLPDIEKADTPRVLFEERITLLRDFDCAVAGLFDLFLKVRRDRWAERTRQIRSWIDTNAAKGGRQ